MSDLRFWFDPVCPFAWLSSRWVRLVVQQRPYDVEWRLISLRLLNRTVDYDSSFPPEYEAGHTAGLRLLRVCAAARDAHGAEVLGPLYDAMGGRIWDRPSSGDLPERVPVLAREALAEAGLPARLVDALEDEAWDAQLTAETDEALALTGKDIGTPVLHVDPPHGVAFFGPVISRLPDPEEAVALWDHVLGLARFPGFAELKRSLRERPQLRAFGVEPGEVGKTEDWHAGSRRLKR